MKKGLLSILAGALVLVGCQNYDDQFDALESQINALSSTVAGLSQVQSDLASLAGTVASLSSTVNGLGDKIKTEVANGLADIASDVASQGTSVAALQASVTELNTAIANASTSAEIAALTSALAAVQTKLDAMSTTSDAQSSDLEELATGLATLTETIATLQTAVNAAASSEELSTLSDAIAAAQDDLDELLANSTVYSDNITINSVATLNAFHAMGDGLNIVNGNVTFDVSTDMDATKVQAVADQLLTITKDLKYEGDAETTVPTFKNLTSVVSLTIDAPGDYRFDNLKSATQIVLGDTHESKIGIVHFGALTNYTALKTDGEGANTVKLTAATEFHFGSVERLVSNKLDITLKKGSVLDLSSVTGLNVDGEVVSMDLDINGPASFKSATIADGTMTFKNVASVDVSGFYGDLVIQSGVDHLVTSKSVGLNIDDAEDLTTATIDIAHDWDPELTAADLLTKKKAGAQDVKFASQDLTTATVTGVPGKITADAQNNLTSLTVLSTGGEDLVVTDNTDLTELIVKGSTLSDVTFTGNDAITLLDLDYTTGFKTGSTAKGGIVNVSSNDDLETLHVSADKIYSFTVKSNAKLATVDFTGMKVIGAATAIVDVRSNNLIASSAVDTYQDADGDGSAEKGDGEGDEEGTSTDKGTYTTESGLDTIYTWLSAAITAGPAASKSIIVAFDKVESNTDKAKESADDTVTDPYTVDLDDEGDVAYVAYITNDADDTAATYETQTALGTLPFNTDFLTIPSEGAYSPADGDGVSVTYPSGTTVEFKIDTDDETLDTFAELVTYFNTNADREGFDLTLSNEGNETRFYTITYYDDDSSATISETGTILFDLSSTVTGLSANVTEGDTATEVLDAIVTAINAGTNSYTATVISGASSKTYSLTPNLEDGSTVDKSPITKYALPGAITISWTGSTASFSDQGTNANYGVSFTLDFVVSAVTKGYLVKAVNESLTNDKPDLVIEEDGDFGTAADLAVGDFFNNGNIDGDDDTEILDETGSYIRSFANSSALVEGADGENTNRVSWLK